MKKGLLFFVLLFAGIQLVAAQNLQVSGKVTYADDNAPVIGATIVVKGTSTATLSDVNGMYQITVPANAAAKVLVVSYAGLETQEKPVTSGGEVIDFAMKTDAQQVEALQVIGYGSARKVGSVVGSVTQVTAKKLENRPNASVMDALQGQVAGLQVYTSSGEPSKEQTVRLHGVGSIGSSNSPLFILDGIPVSASAIQAMNPNDFESVSVMKDASATSIYGSRAANGVIYYTTKRGTRGDARVSVGGYYGVSTQANKKFYDNMMSTDELWALWKETDIVDAQTFAAWKKLGYDKNNTDWFRYMQREWAPTYSADLSITGGNEKTNYYISGSMYRQDGVARQSYYERYNVRTNIESKVKDWMTVGANISLYTDARQSNENYGDSYLMGGLAYFIAPMYSPYYDDPKTGERKEYWDQVIPGADIYNPDYYALMNPEMNRVYGTASSAYITLEPVKNLKITSRGGLDFRYLDQEYKRMPSFIGSPDNGRMDRAATNELNATITNTIEYSFDIAPEHSMTVLAGQEGIHYQASAFSATTQGLTSDRLMQLGFGSQSTYAEKSSSATYTYLSFFGRLNYTFGDRLFIDATVRNDQSSRFAPENRSATFWSLGARWNLKKEFLEDNRTITDLGVKASYGSQGNSEIGNYTWQYQIGMATRYNQKDGWGISQPGNQNLKWETQYKLTVGANISLWNRLNINVEYYMRDTEDMLLPKPLPGTSGFSDYMFNAGALSNHGVDVQINYDILRERDYYLNVGFNINYNEMKVKRLFDGRQDWTMPGTGLTYVVGQPLQYYYALYAGVDPTDGKQMWYLPGEDRNVTQRDPNKVTKTFDENALMQNTGKNVYGPIAGGFSIGGGWKGISIQADFSFVIGKYLYNNDGIFINNPVSGAGMNQAKGVVDYWKKPGDVTYYPNWAAGAQMVFDDHLLEDASFMRLKNLTIGYQFPKKWFQTQKVVSGFRIYATGRNLWTVTKYSGIDPEVDSNLTRGMVPNTTQFILGVELTF